MREDSASIRAAYVHVPFCRHHCGYCNFTVLAGHDDLVDPFLEALGRELALLEQPREVDTLFFGGGTPTHLDEDQLSRLLELVGDWFPLAAGGEFSIEANPADLTKEKTRLLADQGVTRISLGSQSFDDQKLTLLERDHRAADVFKAFELARKYMQSVSLDLIFAAPGETLDAWQRDVQQAIDLAPDHLSTYGLTFEKGTTFWNRLSHDELQEVDDETQRSMYLDAIDAITAAGYEHYEVSNFARPGHRCRHNEVYWTGGSYYAAGPGAARHHEGRRETNHRSTTTWMNRLRQGDSPVAESETLSAEEIARERTVFGLRRLEGIDLDEIQTQTGCDLNVLLGDSLQRHLDAGRLVCDGRRLQLSREGLLVSDAIWPDFL